MTVEAIKEAIGKLPEDDRIALTSWLNWQAMDDWDKEMQRDFSPGGKGMKFLAEVRGEIAGGEVRPMGEGFAEGRRRRS